MKILSDFGKLNLNPGKNRGNSQDSCLSPSITIWDRRGGGGPIKFRVALAPGQEAPNPSMTDDSLGSTQALRVAIAEEDVVDKEDGNGEGMPQDTTIVTTL